MLSVDAVHNDRMNPPSRGRGWRALFAASLAAALLLSGCSDDGAADASDGETSSGGGGEGSPPEPYLPVPDGVELTTQGTELGLEESATVAYEPRQDEVGALDITVTRMDKASFDMFTGWKLSPETKTTQPSFVHATIRNVGATDLGGRRPPLYAVDGDNRLIEPSKFASSFTPCPSQDFPKKFQTGDEVDTCLVYLAPDKGDLVAVSFRPTQDFDPIIWVGELTQPEPPKDDKSKGSNKGDKNKNNQGGNN